MLQIAFDILTITLLSCVSAASFLFHRRIARLRDAIVEAGQVLPRLDEAVARMNESADGLSDRVRAEMQAVDGRVAVAKRLASDLAIAARDAEEAIGKFDAQLRQAKRLGMARAAAVPRELAEPKGFAERIERLATEGTDVSRLLVAEPPPGRQEPRFDDMPMAAYAEMPTAMPTNVAAAPAPAPVSRDDDAIWDDAHPHLHRAPSPALRNPAAPAPMPAEPPRRERPSALSIGAFNSFASHA